MSKRRNWGMNNLLLVNEEGHTMFAPSARPPGGLTPPASSKGRGNTASKRQYSKRPGSANMGLPLQPVYTNDLLEGWLHSNRQRTLPKDKIDLKGWPMDRKSVASLSRICYKATELNLKDAPGVNDNIILRMTYVNRLRKLNLSGCKEITDEGVEIIRKNFGKLRELQFENVDQITINSIPLLISTTTSLEKLNLAKCYQMTDAVLHALAIRLQPVGNRVDLTDLNMMSCTRLTDAGVGELLQKCTGLVTLNLRYCSNVGGMAFSPLQKTKLKSLTYLDVSGMEIHDLDLSWITGGCVNLKTLFLERIHTISDDGMSLISDSLQALESLSLNGCTKLGDRGLFHLIGYQKGLRELKRKNEPATSPSSSVKKKHGDPHHEEHQHLEAQWKQTLETLGLSSPKLKNTGAEDIDGNADDVAQGTELLDASGGCLSLKHLSLKKCSNISSNGLVGVGRTARHIKLESFHLQKLSGGATIHEKGVLQLIRSKQFLINIKKLSFIDQNCIYENVLCKVLSVLKNLEYLDLTGCVHVSDKVLFGLIGGINGKKKNPVPSSKTTKNNNKEKRKLRKKKMKQKNPALDEVTPLKIGFENNNEEKNDTENSKIAFISRPLQYLNLTRCKQITDNGVQPLFKSNVLPNLKHLILSTCDKVTDKTLIALSRSKSAKTLTSINLVGNLNITENGLIALARRCDLLLTLNVNKCMRITNTMVDTLSRILWKSQISKTYLGIEPRPLPCVTALEMSDRDNEAAIVIQRRYRIRLLGKARFRRKQLERLRRMEYERDMYIRLQSWWRAVYAKILFQNTKELKKKVMEQRRLEKAATMVQTAWRGRMSRKATAPRLWQLKRSKSATKIEAHARGYLIRKKTYEMKKRMQDRSKVAKSLKKIKNRLLNSSFTSWATYVNRIVRVRALAYKAFCGKQRLRLNMWKLWLKLKKRFVKTMIRKIQRWWRRYLKKQADAAATSLQNMWRSKSARKQMAEKKRRHKEKERKVKGMLNRIKMRVVYKCLMAFHSNMLQARRVKRLAMRCMMSDTRVKFDIWKEKYLDIKERKMISSVVVQKRWRGNKGRQKARLHRKIKGADRLLRNDKVVRASFRKRFAKRQARRLIVHWWRRSLLRWRVPIFLMWWRHNSSSTIQRHWRGFVGRKIARKRFKNFSSAALNIQRVYRGHLGRKEAAKMRLTIHLHRAACVLQRHYRAKLARRYVSEERARQIAASQMIQRVYRGHGGRYLTRKQKLKRQIQLTRHFAERFKSAVGLTGNLSNIKALEENFDLEQRIEEYRRFTKARIKKQRFLLERFERAKRRCEEITTVDMGYQKRVECVTEGIFLDSVKRGELKHLNKFLTEHFEKLTVGLKSIESAILTVVKLKILFDDVEFHRLRNEHLPIPAAVQVKGMRLDHVGLRNSHLATWYMEELIKAEARRIRGATPASGNNNTGGMKTSEMGREKK